LWQTREPGVTNHPRNMELLGIAALFAGLALVAALPLLVLLTLADSRSHEPRDR
jgi:hypothetical protein